MTEERLPPELEERIERNIRSGITYSADRHHRPLLITRIHWRRQFNDIPADPDALAEAIIRKVGEQEMSLDLDGQEYVIRKVFLQVHAHVAQGKMHLPPEQGNAGSNPVVSAREKRMDLRRNGVTRTIHAEGCRRARYSANRWDYGDNISSTADLAAHSIQYPWLHLCRDCLPGLCSCRKCRTGDSIIDMVV